MFLLLSLFFLPGLLPIFAHRFYPKPTRAALRAVAPLIFACLSAACFLAVGNPTSTQDEENASRQAAKQKEASAPLGAAEDRESRRLVDKADKEKKLSDTDVNWLRAFYYQSRLRPGIPLSAPAHHIRTLLAFSYACPSLTSVQREQVAQLCLPLLSSVNPRLGSAEKACACNALRKLNYRAAVPRIKPLTTDSNKYVREAAQRAVTALE